MASEFKCTKAIFTPTRDYPTRVHPNELDMYDAFNHYYGYDIYTRENPLLKAIYEYVATKSLRKGPSFCSKGSGVGVTTTYLSNHLLKIINGKDAETTIMCCYNKDNNQSYSILLYKYDEENNSIYIDTVCADQTTGEDSKGSGRLLINSLVHAVSDTGKIEHIYLHAVPSAVSTYERTGFKKTGNTLKDDDVMDEMKMTFQTLDVDEPSSESWGNVSPEYNPHTPEYDPKPWSNSSPVYNPGSPVDDPESPKPWSNFSPVYNPYFPVDDPESSETVPYGGRRSSHKTKKRSYKTKKRTCKTKKYTRKTKKRNYKKRSNRSSISKSVR